LYPDQLFLTQYQKLQAKIPRFPLKSGALDNNRAHCRKADRVGLCTDRNGKNPTAEDASPAGTEKNRPLRTMHQPELKKNNRYGKNPTAKDALLTGTEKIRPQRTLHQPELKKSDR
jgi:hypothetical protein